MKTSKRFVNPRRHVVKLGTEYKPLHLSIIEGDSIPYAFDERRSAPPPGVRGKHCFVMTEGEALEQAAAALGRQAGGLCLKVFFIPLEPLQHIDAYYWGRERPGRERAEERDKGRISGLYEATVIQNLCAIAGYSPRVYGIVLVERGDNLYPAQVTDSLESGTAMTSIESRKRLVEIGQYLTRFGCCRAGNEIKVGPRDFLSGLFIDFQGFRFTDLTESAIVSQVKEIGRYGKSNYQSVAHLLGPNPRDTQQRTREMGLKGVRFAGKSVLDVGCNMGAMCFYAADRKARRVLGVDQPCQVQAAQILAAYLGYWNVDFRVLDLMHEDLDDDFDITFFLSMCAHVGLPEWVCETTDFLIFEENAKGSRFKTDYWIEHLRERFECVVLRGATTDHNEKFPKPVIFAENFS